MFSVVKESLKSSWNYERKGIKKKKQSKEKKGNRKDGFLGRNMNSSSDINEKVILNQYEQGRQREDINGFGQLVDMEVQYEE